MKTEIKISENENELKSQLKQISESLEMRNKQLDILAREVTNSLENLKKVFY